MDLSQVKISINDNGTVDLDNGFFMSTTVSYNEFKALLAKGNGLVAQHERYLSAKAEAQKPKEHA